MQEEADRLGPPLVGRAARRVNKCWSVGSFPDVPSSGTLFRTSISSPLKPGMPGHASSGLWSISWRREGCPRPSLSTPDPYYKQGTRRMGLPLQRAATLHRTGKRTFGNIVPSRCACNVARDKFRIAVSPRMSYPI